MNKVNLYEKTFQGGIFLSPDDLLYVEAISGSGSLSFKIEGCALNLDNSIIIFSETLTMTTINAIISKSISLGYKFLFSLSVTDPVGSFYNGDLFVRCSLRSPRGGLIQSVKQILCQGYVSSIEGISFGNGQVNPSTYNKETLAFIFISAPGANTDFHYSCPDYNAMDIISVRFSLQTSAVAGNRQVGLQIVNPDTYSSFCFTARLQAASLSYTYSFNLANTSDILVGSFVSAPLPDFKLKGSWSIDSLIQGFQVGDQLSNIYLHVLRRINPTPF